jgi:prophage regulatory protein
MTTFSSDGYLRLAHIVGNPKKNIPALIPISKSSWFRGVQNGLYAAGIKLSPGITVWKASAIRALIAEVR